MIGTKATATLWQVDYRFSRPDVVDHQSGATKVVQGRVLVLSADPSGCDICDVARTCVLCDEPHGREFTLMHVARVGDVAGLVRVEERSQ